MNETVYDTGGGFTGDPAAALHVAGAAGCCGNPSSATMTLDPFN